MTAPLIRDPGKVVGRLKLEELKAKAMVRVEHPPFDIVVAWTEGEILAIEDACNHAGASLAEGWLEPDCCIVCPMHGYVFELRTGKLARPKGLCADQRVYRVAVEGEDVVIYDDFNLLVTA